MPGPAATILPRLWRRKPVSSGAGSSGSWLPAARCPSCCGPISSSCGPRTARGELRVYPGSPALARAVLRPQDRIELIELHGTDHAALAAWTAPGTTARREDGLAALAHRLPPPERRGVVLIDPSYELKTDYQDVVAALAIAHHRFATGTFLLWYPVIERARTDAMLAGLAATTSW